MPRFWRCTAIGAKTADLSAEGRKESAEGEPRKTVKSGRFCRHLLGRAPQHRRISSTCMCDIREMHGATEGKMVTWLYDLKCYLERVPVEILLCNSLRRCHKRWHKHIQIGPAIPEPKMMAFEWFYSGSSPQAV